VASFGYAQRRGHRGALESWSTTRWRDVLQAGRSSGRTTRGRLLGRVAGRRRVEVPTLAALVVARRMPADQVTMIAAVWAGSSGRDGAAVLPACRSALCRRTKARCRHVRDRRRRPRLLPRPLKACNPAPSLAGFCVHAQDVSADARGVRSCPRHSASHFQRNKPRRAVRDRRSTGVRTSPPHRAHGTRLGCDLCTPVASSWRRGSATAPTASQFHPRDPNYHFLGHLHANCTYSRGPATHPPLGEVTPYSLIAIGECARLTVSGLYTKITFGPRIEPFRRIGWPAACDLGGGWWITRLRVGHAYGQVAAAREFPPPSVAPTGCPRRACSGRRPSGWTGRTRGLRIK